jgi:acetylornithine deacetylase/succinyl-diaminopimelate desuccinylase-like protein
MKWVEQQGFKPERFEENNLSPLILVDIPATKQNSKTVLMYGHMDKQPPSDGWNEGLGKFQSKADVKVLINR